MTSVYTIGHSRHERAAFLELLRRHRVAAVIDVRSRPYSKWAPQFSKAELERWLTGAGVAYRFMGRELGGMLGDGVTHDERSREPDFVAAIDRLVELAAASPSAILCAEEDPARCHRRMLIAPALAPHADVLHIRGDGSLEREPGQLSLL